MLVGIIASNIMLPDNDKEIFVRMKWSNVFLERAKKNLSLRSKKNSTVPCLFQIATEICIRIWSDT
jgi:hypothetical protein